MTPFVLPEFQNRYGTGNLTTPINVASYSWGKRLNRANRYGYDPREDYFRTGVANSESVSLSTGTEKNQTYFQPRPSIPTASCPTTAMTVTTSRSATPPLF